MTVTSPSGITNFTVFDSAVVTVVPSSNFTAGENVQLSSILSV